MVAFPIIWSNERKQVKIVALIIKGRNECQDVLDY